jgi:hypothetical protein
MYICRVIHCISIFWRHSIFQPTYKEVLASQNLLAIHNKGDIFRPTTLIAASTSCGLILWSISTLVSNILPRFRAHKITFLDIFYFPIQFFFIIRNWSTQILESSFWLPTSISCLASSFSKNCDHFCTSLLNKRFLWTYCFKKLYFFNFRILHRYWPKYSSRR